MSLCDVWTFFSRVVKLRKVCLPSSRGTGTLNACFRKRQPSCRKPTGFCKMPSKNKEIAAEIKGHRLAYMCSAKKFSILGQGAICFCGVYMLTTVITQLWSSDAFCGRFKINVMDGQGLGCRCLSKPCSELLQELLVRSALALSPDQVCSDYS